MEETISPHHHLKRLWLQDTHWPFYILDSLQAKFHLTLACSSFVFFGRHHLRSAPGTALNSGCPPPSLELVTWLYLWMESESEYTKWNPKTTRLKTAGLAIVDYTYWDETEPAELNRTCSYSVSSDICFLLRSESNSLLNKRQKQMWRTVKVLLLLLKYLIPPIFYLPVCAF